MDKKEILAKIKILGLVAVIRGPSPELTIKMVTALVAGGVTGIEITYSTPGAAQVVRSLRSSYGDALLLGMGTLTERRQVEEANDAGASFIVSPICEPALTRAMTASGLACMIGALTPTEIFQAYTLGSDVVKIFPGSLVGPAYIKALKGPFPDIPMMPTGGVSLDNIPDWFVAGVFAVGAGSELCPTDLVKVGRWDEITRRAAEFVKVVRSART